MAAHSDDAGEKTERHQNHDEFANNSPVMKEKSGMDTPDMGVGDVATPPNFDHIDEKKILWKVSHLSFTMDRNFTPQTY